jgi:hypothetical protein
MESTSLTADLDTQFPVFQMRKGADSVTGFSLFPSPACFSALLGKKSSGTINLSYICYVLSGNQASE